MNFHFNIKEIKKKIHKVNGWNTPPRRRKCIWVLTENTHGLASTTSPTLLIPTGSTQGQIWKHRQFFHDNPELLIQLGFIAIILPVFASNSPKYNGFLLSQCYNFPSSFMNEQYHCNFDDRYRQTDKETHRHTKSTKYKYNHLTIDRGKDNC